MNASTDREVTVFWCKVARPHFRTAFAVLLDMLMNPLLEPEEVEKEREVIQEELRMTYDNPSYRVDLLIDEALWPEQAMAVTWAARRTPWPPLTRQPSAST